MAGQLDSLFKSVAKQVVADLGNSLDTSITYIRKTSPVYNSSTGVVTTTDTTYTFKAPIEFIDSDEESGFQENTARLYITPDQIGDSQPVLQDEISISFSGSTRFAKIMDIRTLKGGQEYLFRLRIVF
tara:strand:+ start:192 stop:575 length:384 start_codon:yes stop_codon:yes gene_type:complete